jgi:hypothetical protein
MEFTKIRAEIDRQDRPPSGFLAQQNRETTLPTRQLPGAYVRRCVVVHRPSLSTGIRPDAQKQLERQRDMHTERQTDGEREREREGGRKQRA